MNDRKGEVDLIFENGKSPDRISHLKSRETYFAIYQSLERIKTKSRFNSYILARCSDISFLKSFSSIQKKSFFSFLKFFFNPKAKCRQTPSFPHSRNFFFSIQTFLFLILKNFFFQKIYFFLIFKNIFFDSKDAQRFFPFLTLIIFIILSSI